MKQRFFKMAASCALVACLVSGVFVQPAAAEDLQVLLDRIERLERDIRTLNIQVARGTGAPVEGSTISDTESASFDMSMSNPAVARIDARITSLENDVRVSTGNMESIDHKLFQLSSQMEKLVSDVDYRLSVLESRAGLTAQTSLQPQETTMPTIQTAPATGEVTMGMAQSESGVLGQITETELQNITPETNAVQSGVSTVQSDVVQSTTLQDPTAVQSAAVDPAVPAITMTPKEEYTQAFGLLRQAKYDDAAVALQAFIDNNPGDSLAANARYWLGETFYVRSEFIRAAEIFFEGYRTSPAGPKAPDTLLKLGMALGSLGKKAEACAAFTKLNDEFPSASSNVRSTMERERLRNGCS